MTGGSYCEARGVTGRSLHEREGDKGRERCRERREREKEGMAGPGAAASAARRPAERWKEAASGAAAGALRAGGGLHGFGHVRVHGRTCPGDGGGKGSPWIWNQRS